MEANLHFMMNLVVILGAAGLGGLVAKKLNQPAILGQILAGVLVGPSVLDFAESTEFIKHLSEIGVILLMFLAGLETDFEELKKRAGESSLVALGGILAPFILGFAFMAFYQGQFDYKEAIYVGVMLTATSMGVTVSTLSELNVLRSKLGMTILGAAIIDDVAGIVILTVVLGWFGASSTGIMSLVINIVLFFLLMATIGNIFSKGAKKITAMLKKVKSQYLIMGSVFAALFFALLASDFGISAIIGSYLIGLIISTTDLKHRVNDEVHRFGTGFFVPIFFANIGLGLNLAVIPNYIWLVVGISIVGIASKIIGSYIGAKLVGFHHADALKAGISMVPRAEVALIMAKVGLASGFISEGVFTGIIGLVITSSIFTPIILKRLMKKSLENPDVKAVQKKVA